MFQDLAAEVPIVGLSQIVQVQITRTRPVAQVDEAALLSCFLKLCYLSYHLSHPDAQTPPWW